MTKLKTCKAKFCLIQTSNKVFCSRDCFNDYRINLRHPKICANIECKTELKKLTGSKYCSTNCRYVSNSKIPFSKKPRCIYCKKRFYTLYKPKIECDKCLGRISYH